VEENGRKLQDDFDDVTEKDDDEKADDVFPKNVVI
jgi:hypothetical protein